MTLPKKDKTTSSSEITSIISFYNEMSNNLKDMIKGTTTLEEKLKALVETQDDFTDKIEQMMNSYNALLCRIINVEAKDLDKLLVNVNDTSNRLTILEHKTKILVELNEIANKHENMLAILDNNSRDLKEKVKERSKTIHELVLKIERLNLHKSSTEKLFDTIFKVATSITIAYIIYMFKIGN